MRALLVEDDFAIRDAVFRLLREAEFDVVPMIDGRSALAEGLARSFDIAVVDIGLPKLSGLEVIRGLRHAGLDTPIVIITGLGSSADCVAGLEAGADDYIVKPFRLAELQARIRALIRRHKAGWISRTTVGDLEFDRCQQAFYAQASPLILSRRESEILAALMEQPGDLVRKDALVRRLSHWDHAVTPNLIEVYVHKLRKRLQPLQAEILTVRGLGYVIRGSQNPAPPEGGAIL